MASLKEIKGRINSVKSTQKITSAMKMVASSKLRKAQYQTERFLPYQQKLNEMLNAFLSSKPEFDSKLSENREVKRAAIVVFSSNSSLCGIFNSNVQRLLVERLSHYKRLKCPDVRIYTVGKKIQDYAQKIFLPFKIKGDYFDLIDKPYFEGAKEIADQLIRDFLEEKIDRVDVIYNHFKSSGVQIPVTEQYLPIDLNAVSQTGAPQTFTDYLIEPDSETILNILIPKSLRSKLYAALLDSVAAEHAARMVAMQIATDNATDLLDELTIQYNKQRQQTITNELLDIVGGSEAQK